MTPHPTEPLCIEEIPLAAIAESPLNPRQELGDVTELAVSIARHGVLQPLIVRRQGGVSHPFSLLAGHRRLAAARLAGLPTVPCLVRQAKDDAEALAVMLVENLQRRDLGPMEEARALFRLSELQHGGSQEEIGQAIGRSQAYVANSLRLLKLPLAVRDLIQSGTLSASHGRALVRFADDPGRCLNLAQKAVTLGHTSKELEALPLENGHALRADTATRAAEETSDEEQGSKGGAGRTRGPTVADEGGISLPGAGTHPQTPAPSFSPEPTKSYLPDDHGWRIDAANGCCVEDSQRRQVAKCSLARHARLIIQLRALFDACELLEAEGAGATVRWRQALALAKREMSDG